MPATLNCSSCGYNLIGRCTSTDPVGACPECGTPYDFVLLTSKPPGVQPGFLWPMLLLLVPPIVLAGGGVMILAASQQSSGWGAELIPGWILAIAGGLGCVGLSIFTGRRIARRLVERPAGSRPTLGSTGLTIAFMAIFCCVQAALAFTLFFLGCLTVIRF